MKSLVLTIVGCVGFGLAGSVWACSPGGAGPGQCIAMGASGGIVRDCTGPVCPQGTALSWCEISRNGVVISCGCVCL